MKNPLSQYLSVDERIDGVYLKVSRNERDSINFDALLTVLEDAAVMNFDPVKIKDVFQRARGAFEKIGPLFEYYDPEIDKYFQINTSEAKALMRVNSGCLLAGRKPTEKSLLYFLKKNGIKHGIKLDQVQVLTNREMFDKFIIVAEATPPENGHDAIIKMNISLSPDVKPSLRADGSVDYRTIQTFVPVAKDQVIAEKIPLTKGKPGTSVTGESIASEPGKDLPMPGGKNTVLTNDSNVLKSLKTGIVYVENGLVHVVELLHIRGNVDFSVGNVKYTGDVLVNGNVMPGFTIEAEGDVHIKGEVESARIISRGGVIIIEKGVIGKGDTYLKSKNGVQILFAQDSNIITDGVLLVEKYLLHCDCTCEKLDASAANALVSGGLIRAEKEVVAKQIGSEKGIQTKIALFDKRKDAIIEKIKSLDELENKLKTELEPIERQLRTKAVLLKKAGEGISDRMREEVKKWVTAHSTLSQKIKFVQQNRDKCRQELCDLKNTDGFVKVLANIYPGCEIDLYGIKFMVSNLITNKKIHLGSNNSIEFEG